MSEKMNFMMNDTPSKGEITVLFSGQSQTDNGHDVGPAVLDYLLIHCVQSGYGRLTMRETTYHLEKGDSFFIFPGELFRYVADDTEPWAYRWIALRGTHIEGMLASIGIGPHAPVVHPVRTARVAAAFKKVQSALCEGGISGDLEAEAYARLALAEFSRATHLERLGNKDVCSDIERQVEQAVCYITLRYSTPISIESLAQQFGYHRTYFSKMFHEITGESPIQLLIRLRMERARTLIMTTKLAVEQVAASVGYNDALYFSKMYKRWFGMSPSSYRKTYQPAMLPVIKMD
ncbi:AraC family transcriptional regulator [Paenibacillus taiwanensis]|uniref:AraC family transcriptional regulator n=1 Tax=Paenibacillus taiwanensis TaxID=401638 RepID=UPI0003F87335|nr:AraC family transcriptional regulator [Paenibacillus taiwanensis]